MIFYALYDHIPAFVDTAQESAWWLAGFSGYVYMILRGRMDESTWGCSVRTLEAGKQLT